MKKYTALLSAIVIPGVVMAGASKSPPPQDAEQSVAPEAQIADYIKKFPYQDTYNYLVKYTGGDAAKINTWILGVEPELVKAGDDKVVRMNNDTYYKMAFFILENGPVVLESTHPGSDRFSSFQLMDDHNVNFDNVMNPDGKYTLYYGEKPAQYEGEAIESPSSLALVIVRVEVKDKEDSADVAAAKKIFTGIHVKGPVVQAFPQLDLLGDFSKEVEVEALARMDQVSESEPFSALISGPGDVPEKVSYLQLAAGTKGGWGGPVTSHSAYEFFFVDDRGDDLVGANGTYTVTTPEPPVEAFWSVTIYDTDRGGFLHPNAENRYHINNTTAVKNADGTVTFTFKQTCEAGDLNCLEVPAGRFDYVARYYLPSEAVQSGEWKMPKAVLQEN